MRTFIAVDLPLASRTPLVRLLRAMPRAEGVKWCTEHQLHVTLKFLGDITDAQLARVCKVCEAACRKVSPFEVAVCGLGVFPAPRNPRVLWAGVTDPDEGCVRWVEAADPLLEELGFKPETRAFRPHITLGRSRSSAGAAVLAECLGSCTLPEGPHFIAGDVVLFESLLGAGGSRYKPLARFALAGGS